MRQYRSFRPTSAVLALALVNVAGASLAASVPLRFENENVVEVSALQITSGGPGILNVTAKVPAPVLCGNVTTPAFGNTFDPVLPGFNPSNGDFIFGAMNAGNTRKSVPGIASLNYHTTGLTLNADPTLVCYVLSADGVHKISPRLFYDDFSEPNGDASILTRVVVLPSFDNGNILKYYIDVNIPAELVGVNYAVRDGFDSSLFSATNSYSCEAATTISTTCVVGTESYNSIDVSGSSVTVPPGGVHKRYIVTRPLRAGTGLPTNTAIPLTLAAVFLVDPSSGRPLDTNLSNNVSAGKAELSDLQPAIVTSSLTSLDGLSEGQSLVGRSFVLTDDTAESGGNLLRADVRYDFNGTVTTAAANCGPARSVVTPDAVVERTCTFDVVPPNNDFATDVSPNTYAPGVSASVTIIATDPRGQVTSKVLALHVASADNDAPAFTLSAVAVPDSGNNNMPTIHCSLQAGATTECLGVLADFVVGLAPGPAEAADELASQVAFLGVLPGNRLECVDETSPTIFAFQSNPKYITSGSHIDLDYRLNGVFAGSSLCNVLAGDWGNFPAGQTYREFRRSFRIVVTN